MRTLVEIYLERENLPKLLGERGCIKGWDARRTEKMKPQQPFGCEDFIKPSNAADRLLCAPLFLAGSENSVLILINPHLPLNRLIQRNHCVGGLDVGEFLDGVHKHLHEVVVVEAIELHE